MTSRPHKHFKATASLAKALRPKDVFKWLVSEGYFPEPYVLPPCFFVTKYRTFGASHFPHTKKQFRPRVSEAMPVHFPRTDWTDRTFGVIDPDLHGDIALILVRNWKTVVNTLFHQGNRVASYSFPIPLDSRARGHVGALRAGRLIYEFIEMAEHDLASEAFRYKYIFRTDVKNFYPSLYTHSIPWALHGKRTIRKPANRHDFNRFGNRLDKLFQSANDECTNGLPIGPAVSDLISEVVLSAVDRQFSRTLAADVLAVRFKDDYRILARSQDAGRTAIKFNDPIARAIVTGRFTRFVASKDFKVFRGVKTSAKATSLLKHLDVFAR